MLEVSLHVAVPLKLQSSGGKNEIKEGTCAWLPVALKSGH